MVRETSSGCLEGLVGSGGERLPVGLFSQYQEGIIQATVGKTLKVCIENHSLSHNPG